ncbi:MAG: hypothetical protein WCO13_08315 [Bacteroidota bacterium]
MTQIKKLSSVKTFKKKMNVLFLNINKKDYIYFCISSIIIFTHCQFKTFEVNKDTIKEAFDNYLTVLNTDGTKLINYENNNQEFNYDIGDIDGDNKPDAVVEYAFDLKGEIGTGLFGKKGIVIFKNTGKNLIVIDEKEISPKFERFKNINQGVILMERLDFKEGDPNCCPSEKTTEKYVIRDGKLSLIQNE